ncbi:hypothetical protein BaRGS_00002171 [Batillaria attramentaria]|uniref:C1q domain-containing protein n=1 Tax=Batillaria attramentaria TaxID=370345 RepID=A0ABD0M4J9_9CAEN
MKPVSLYAWHIVFSTLLLKCRCEQTLSFKRSDDALPLETVVMQQTETISQLQAKLASMETEMTSMKSRIATQETRIGFNVRLATTTSQPFTGQETLILGAVDLNQGGGYDKTTGIFTAPIIKNGHTLAEVEANGDDPKYMDRSANSVVVHLAAEDKVWVKRVDGTVNTIQGNYRTSFAGILVIADP